MASTPKSIHLDTSARSTRRQLYRAIRALPEGTYAIDLKPERWSASALQRGYYWGYLVVEVGKLIKLNREQTHSVLGAKFLTDRYTVAGEVVTAVRSLTELDNSALSTYFAQIRIWVWDTYRVRLHEPDSSRRKSS